MASYEESAPLSPQQNGHHQEFTESDPPSKMQSLINMIKDSPRIIKDSPRFMGAYKKMSNPTDVNDDAEDSFTPESSGSGWSTPEGGPMPAPEAELPPLAQMGAALQAEEADPEEELNSESPGFVQKGQVYYMQARGQAMEIIAAVGDKIVFMKAKVCEVALTTKGRTLAYTESAKMQLQAKTMWIQDGYVYISTTIDGKVAIVKAKTSEAFDVVQAKATQGFNVIGEYAAPVTSKAVAIKDSVTSNAVAAKESVTSKILATKASASSKATAVKDKVASKSKALMASSKARATTAVQPLKPYYMKVHNGVVHIVAKMGDKVVYMQAKTTDICRGVQVRIVDSVAAGRGAIKRLTSPCIDKLMIVRSSCVDKVQHLRVSIKSGVISIVGAIDARTLHIRMKVSEVLDAVRVRTTSGVDATKDAISAFTAKISAVVSSIYGQACGNVKLIHTKTSNGLVYIACQMNERTLVFRVKVAELVKYVCSVPLGLYGKSCAAIADGYSLAKVKVLAATQFTKVKSLEMTANVRSIAGKQEAQVAAASAAGGAVALGAGGGAAGLVAGSGVGVVFAPFTFGLSIPMGAAAGLVVGAGAGGTAGFVAGGAAGYGAHKHKDEIGNGVNGIKSKVKAYKALASASTVKLCAQVVGSTGGTATA